MVVQLKKKKKQNQDAHCAYKYVFIRVSYCDLISNLEEIEKLQEPNVKCIFPDSEQNPVCWRDSCGNDRLPQYKMR